MFEAFRHAVTWVLVSVAALLGAGTVTPGTPNPSFEVGLTASPSYSAAALPTSTHKPNASPKNTGVALLPTPSTATTPVFSITPLPCPSPVPSDSPQPASSFSPVPDSCALRIVSDGDGLDGNFNPCYECGVAQKSRVSLRPVEYVTSDKLIWARDYYGPFGSGVGTIDNGVVVYVNNLGYGGGWGKWVGVKHSSDVVSIYAHLNSILVEVGDEVRQGNTIGTLGKTGRATGAFLQVWLFSDFCVEDDGGVSY